MGNNVVVPQKIEDRITIKPHDNRINMGSSNSTFGYVSTKTEGKIPERYLCTYVHGSIIRNSQEVEAALSINE